MTETCQHCSPPDPILSSLKKIEGKIFWLSVLLFILFLSIMGITETTSMILRTVQSTNVSVRKLINQNMDNVEEVE